MKKNPLKFLPAICLVFIFASCEKKDKTGLLIPKDAAMVMHISTSSLSAKLSWDEIKASNWFKKISSLKRDSISEKLMNNPGASGIDLKSDLVYFLKKRARGAYLVIDGKLKDVASFESYCKMMMPDAAVTKDGEFSFVILSEKLVIAWNKSSFAYVVDMPAMNFNDGSPMNYYNGIERKDLMGSSSGNMADSLKQYSKDVLSLSDTKRLGADERFASLVNEPGDIHTWMNVGQLSGMGTMGTYMSMMKMSTLLEGNIYASTINFDNGRITVKGKHYQGKEMTDLLKKYPPKPVEASLINRLPSGNVLAAFALNYSPEGMAEFLKIIGLDGMINLFLGKNNYSIDDFVKANKGEMLFALTDIGTKKVTDTLSVNKKGKPVIFTREKPEIKFVFANAVNNEGAFDKVIELLRGETDRFQKEVPGNITYKLKNNWFAMGDPDNVSAFLSGNNNNVSFAGRISGHPCGAYIDIQKIVSAASRKTAGDSSIAAMMRISMNMWQDVVMTGGDYKDGAVTYETEINLVNKNSNSLKQLNQYIDQLSAVYSDRLVFNRNEADRFMTDSVKINKKKIK